jgi:TetR/AcrR family transcriptional repressor of lmrAB and yxaGH operons
VGSEASPRDRMVEAAVVLLAQHGYQAMSFTTVLERSGAPRGSIYHHFPEGKDQLVAAAVELAGARAVALLEAHEGQPAGEVLDAFVRLWRAVLERSAYGAGCSVLAVAVSADSADLLTRASAVFTRWRDRLADLLVIGGVDEAVAPAVATTIVAATEGAVVLCRAQRSLAPLEDVTGRLHVLVDASS